MLLFLGRLGSQVIQNSWVHHQLLLLRLWLLLLLLLLLLLGMMGRRLLVSELAFSLGI